MESSTKLLRWIIGITFWISTGTALAGTPGSSDLFQKGLEARQRGDLTLAESLLLGALREEPKLAETRFELGLLYIELKRLNEAEEQFRNFLEFRPTSFEAHNNLAAIYAQQGRDAQLERELSTVVQLRPDFIQGHINLADYYLTIALRSLWNGYGRAPAEQKGPFKERILRILAADPETSEEQFIQERIARILVEPVRAANRIAPLHGSGAVPKTFEIQIHSTKSEAEAERVAQRASAAGFKPEVIGVAIGGIRWYRVRISGFESLAIAQQAAAKLIAAGVIREYWVVP